MKLSERCRLCLSKSSVTSDDLFFQIDEGFEAKFNQVTSQQLAKPQTDDDRCNFPEKVCITCVSELEHTFNYINGLVERQKQLNMLLGIKDHPVESKASTAIIKIQKEISHIEESDSQFNESKEQLESEGLEDCINESETVCKEEMEEEQPIYEVAYETAEDDELGLQEEPEEEITSDTEEIYELDEDMETTIDQQEEGYQTDYDEVCFVAGSDHQGEGESDDECNMYHVEITAEEEPQLFKRKYTKQPKDTLKQFKCWIEDCGSSFSFRATAAKHMQQSHSITCDRSTCFICGSRFNNYADFLAHVKTHTRKSQCDVCMLTFVNDEKLKSHKVKFHKKNDDEERNFICSQCNARFKRKEHVNSHMVYKHSGQDARKFSCKECPSLFLTRQDLRNHEKSHTQVKIKCIYCNYECRDLKSIRRHAKKLHNSLKIYKCSCDEVFELYRSMQAHKKNCPGAMLIGNVSEY